MPLCLRPGICLTTLSLLLLAEPAPSPAAPAAKFNFPTGRVTYKVTSPMMTGTTVLSWTENGKKFRQDMNGHAGQPGQAGGPGAMQIRTWALSDGKHVYQKQPLNNVVLRMKLPKEGQAMLSSATPFVPSGKDKGKVVGKATVLGKPCEIRELRGGAAKIWVWQNLPLKMEAGSGAQMKMVATKIEIPAKVDPSKFKVPAGYEIKDMELPSGSPPQLGPGAK